MEDPRHPIFLIGFMASGKTTIGRSLSRQLRRPFFDLDSNIETSAGKAIHLIIKDHGEEAFRDMESSELGKAAKHPRAIIATGGGIVLRESNRTLMSTSGETVWLDTPFDECWRRIETDSIVRPLAPTREAAMERWLQRRNLYALARFRIELEAMESSDDVAERIVKLLVAEDLITRF